MPSSFSREAFLSRRAKLRRLCGPLRAYDACNAKPVRCCCLSYLSMKLLYTSSLIWLLLLRISLCVRSLTTGCVHISEGSRTPVLNIVTPLFLIRGRPHRRLGFIPFSFRFPHFLGAFSYYTSGLRFHRLFSLSV